MELWLVRHGQTEWSEAGKHTSTTDLPLLEDGERDAIALRPRLEPEHFDLVLTSPRQRARRTAELAGFPDAEVDEDLVEWAYGNDEGRTTEEIREDVPEWTVWTHGPRGGETADQVGARCDRVIERVRDVERALVFGHGHSLRALTARWLDEPVPFGRHVKLDTATLSTLGFERETPVVLRWNG
ncbi:histidine phosphatase family protein [Nocardioides marmoribigeumensis]|jgi:probable phosphoglycerate mutase|uniref:Phosphoglycerate mutase n=1 Tax=Nocardioides marmoribigeumensis TaxID=433649 RepID=A0ABU2BTX1_9ACTN|nr:histidine phosphatase family protein [Nocardioides marmoribigeumensis]MDR7360814.1 putative phosphoglycerate mutase [Nocardioides marmoribigeumensis]